MEAGIRTRFTPSYTSCCFDSIDHLQRRYYHSNMRLVSALPRLQRKATQRQARWEGTTMRKTLIMGILSIGLLTIVISNTYARPGDYAAHGGEVALDLS